MAKSDGSSYFKRTSYFWMISITLGMSYYTCIVFAPENIPVQYLGPFGTFCSYLMDNHSDILYKGWWVSFFIHVLESLVALKVCSSKGILSVSTRLLWFLQTFLFGFASLAHLLKYDPKRPKQQ